VVGRQRCIESWVCDCYLRLPLVLGPAAGRAAQTNPTSSALLLLRLLLFCLLLYMPWYLLPGLDSASASGRVGRALSSCIPQPLLLLLLQLLLQGST
jgi:hypothetical protein